MEKKIFEKLCEAFNAQDDARTMMHLENLMMMIRSRVVTEKISVQYDEEKKA